MSYPFVGMPGILPEGQEWDAKTIEEQLRRGIHIYLEEEGLKHDELYVVCYADGKFKITDPFIRQPGDEAPCSGKTLYENESFLEFAVWVAFYGRDFL